MAAEITIRRAESSADYRACQEAQRLAWGLADESYVIPVATMVGAQLHGGLVLGAFLPTGEAVGISFGFLGRIGGRIGLYSQLTGIVPAYQDQGLGGRLKFAQREIARSEGIEVIAWAFDPLQAGNAHFNLHKLGATAARYIDNMYGPRTDALNRGVPTDRLIVEWETTPIERPQLDQQAAHELPRIVEASNGDMPSSDYAPLAAQARSVILEIPDKINVLRAEAPDSAESWRVVVRAGFLAAYQARYYGTDFLRQIAGAQERCFYVLRRD
jgi:predicted GNAT superfamily acetyltransferase